jgi:hypothetical protein
MLDFLPQRLVGLRIAWQRSGGVLRRLGGRRGNREKCRRAADGEPLWEAHEWTVVVFENGGPKERQAPE